MKNTMSEIYKMISLPIFRIGVIFIIAISVFFSFQNIQVINELVNGTSDIANLEEITKLSEFQTVRDAVLSSPYQASVLFLPILFALLFSTEYQFSQKSLTELLTTNWKLVLSGKVFSAVLTASILTIVLSIINSLMLYLLLDPSLIKYLSPYLILEVTLRILLFSITLTLLSMLVVEITKKSIPSVVVIIGLLVVTLSGVVKILSISLYYLLPLIGAKSFAFGRVEAGNPSQLYGLMLLLSQTSIILVVLYLKNWFNSKRGKHNA